MPNHDDGEGVERVIAAKNANYESPPDKAGDFAIRLDGKVILVEHRSQKEDLLRVVEGTSARDICLTLIRNGWVSKLNHAAYLGRELTRAELALHEGRAFLQDDDRPMGTTT
jgi:tetrahydromethanopterin S-methyltransferase subunit A